MSDQEDSSTSTPGSTPARARGLFDTIRTSLWSANTPSASGGDSDHFCDTPATSLTPLHTPRTGESELFTTPREGPSESAPPTPWRHRNQDLEEFQRRVEALGRDPRVARDDVTLRLGAMVEEIAARLGFVAPLDMMGWGESEFREAQMAEVRKLRHEKERLHVQQMGLRDETKFLGEEVGRLEEYLRLTTGDPDRDEGMYFEQRDAVRAELYKLEDELGELRGKLDHSSQSAADLGYYVPPDLEAHGDGSQPDSADPLAPTQELLDAVSQLADQEIPRTPTQETAARRREMRDQFAALEQRRTDLMLRDETLTSLIEGKDVEIVRAILEAKEEKAEDVASRLAVVDRQLGRWKESAEKSTDFVSPADVVAERKKYQARVSELESALEDLKRGKRRRMKRGSNGDADGESHTGVQKGALERLWLKEKLSYPDTSEDWEDQVKAILASAREREEELGQELCYISDRKAGLDFREAELLGYKKRIEGNVHSVEESLNELLDMINGAQNNLNKPQVQGRDTAAKGKGKNKEKGRGNERVTCGGDGISVDKAMVVADFDKTHDLARRIAAKVETTLKSMDDFWEDDRKKKGMSMRRPWELVTAIKERDNKITGLEDEVHNLGGKVARFIRQLDRVKETTSQIVDTAETTQTTDGTRALKDQISTLTHLVSRIVSDANDDGANVPEAKKAEPAPSGEDEPRLLWKDEYGNVIKMEAKFSEIKEGLEMQVDKLQALTSEYKASRDSALSSAQESRDACKKLRSGIDSLKDKSIREVESAVRDCEIRHSTELREHRADMDALKEAMKRCRDELREKATECENLEDKVTEEKRRLLAYKEERFLREGDLNPVVQALLEQGDKQRKALEDKVAELKKIISGLKSRNAALENALELEKKRLKEHLEAMNVIPSLQRDLHAVRTAANEYQRDLKERRSEVETLQNELRKEKHTSLDLKYEETQLRGMISDLDSQLREANEAEQKKTSDTSTKLKLEVEELRNKADLFHRAWKKEEEDHRKILDQIRIGEAAAKAPSGLLKKCLTDVVELRQERLDAKTAALTDKSDRDYAVRQLKELNEELILMKEAETKLRDDLFAAWDERDKRQKRQARFDNNRPVTQIPEDTAGGRKYKSGDASVLWQDTPAGVSNNILMTRHETLMKNLAKVLRHEGPMKGVKDESPNLDVSSIKSPMVLFDSVEKIYATWHPGGGPPQATVTRADMAIFWHHGTLLDKKLALLRAIKDGDQARGYKIVDDLNRFLQETDLGPISDEIRGSVQYLQAYFHLHTTGDLAAAEAAIRFAREHRPNGWSRRLYIDLGSKLERDLHEEKETRRSRKPWEARSCSCIVRILSCPEHMKEACSCTHRNTIKYCDGHQDHFDTEAVLDELDKTSSEY